MQLIRVNLIVAAEIMVYKGLSAGIRAGGLPVIRSV